MPTLLLWGRDDDETPLSDAETIHSLIAGSQLFVYDGGHCFFSDVPDAVYREIDTFFHSHA